VGVKNLFYATKIFYSSAPSYQDRRFLFVFWKN
jgi:hypothetical protein